VVSGDVRIAGRSTGDVVVLAGDATVSGRIEGDLLVASGQARLLPSAHVTGDVRYGDERPIVAGRAIVRGDITKKSWNGWSGFLPFVGIVFWLSVSISAALLGALLLLIAAITLVGLPLAVAILLALLPIWAVAYVCSAWVLGRQLVKPPRGRILGFLAGLGILRAIALIPALGGFVSLAAAIFGLGLIGTAIGADRQLRQPAPAPARSPGS
jgi:hypothetical protein